MSVLHTCNQRKDAEQEVEKQQQNIEALNDTIEKSRTKIGKQEESIKSFITSVNNLRELNSKLHTDLDNTKGNVASLSRLVASLKQDTSKLRESLNELKSDLGDITQVNDTTYQIPWKLHYTYDSLNYDEFSGKTLFSVSNKDPLKFNHENTEITDRESQIELTWGQKIVDDKLKVFVQTNYPGFTSESLRGVLIDPKDNELFEKYCPTSRSQGWFKGLSISVGATSYYDIKNERVGFVIGPSIGIDIYSWSW
ncbi:MAG: hypothetical protein ACOCZ5_00970 [bacterium]